MTSGKMPLSYYIGAAIMVARAAFYFIIRFHLPRRVAMDKGARIRGIGNIEFNGWLKVGAYALLDARYCKNLKLGKHVSLGDYSILRCSGSPSFMCPGVTIGTGVTFGPYSNIGGGYGLTIADGNMFGPYVSLHPETHVIEDADRPIREQGIDGLGITIGPDNWFGAKATILDGVVLGSGNVIAAGAILPKNDYGSNLILGGVPARQLGTRR